MLPATTRDGSLLAVYFEPSFVSMFSYVESHAATDRVLCEQTQPYWASWCVKRSIVMTRLEQHDGAREKDTRAIGRKNNGREGRLRAWSCYSAVCTKYTHSRKYSSIVAVLALLWWFLAIVLDDLLCAFRRHSGPRVLSFTIHPTLRVPPRPHYCNVVFLLHGFRT